MIQLMGDNQYGIQNHRCNVNLKFRIHVYNCNSTIVAKIK